MSENSNKTITLDYKFKKRDIGIPSNYKELEDEFLKAFNENKNSIFEFSYLDEDDTELSINKNDPISDFLVCIRTILDSDSPLIKVTLKKEAPSNNNNNSNNKPKEENSDQIIENNESEIKGNTNGDNANNNKNGDKSIQYRLTGDSIRSSTDINFENYDNDKEKEGGDKNIVNPYQISYPISKENKDEKKDENNFDKYK